MIPYIRGNCANTCNEEKDCGSQNQRPSWTSKVLAHLVELFPRHQKISLVTKRGDFLRRKYGRYGYRRVRQRACARLKVPTKQLNGAASGSTTGPRKRLRPRGAN